MTPGFWRGRRVLLTGHTGFKGAWLALWLDGLDAEVAGYSLAAPTTPSLYDEARVGDSLAAEAIADIRDGERLRSFTDAFQPEIVLHLAAQSLVRRSYAEPVATYATNVLGTVNVLEAARTCDAVRVVLVVTSDKCYENRGAARPLNEDDPLGGDDPYSSSKACTELVTAAYRRSFFGGRAAVASARAGNVIGGGDWAEDRLVADAMLAFGAGRPVRLRNPEAVRPWQHVLDALHGYLVLCEALAADGARHADGWNFGPASAEARTVAWLVAELARLWGDGAGWEADRGEHPPEAPALQLDSAKARTRLAWRPLLPLDQALEWVVEWYRDRRRDPARAHALCRAQLERFQALAAA